MPGHSKQWVQGAARTSNALDRAESVLGTVYDWSLCREIAAHYSRTLSSPLTSAPGAPDSTTCLWSG